MALVEEEKQYWPGEIEISVSRDKSKDVNDMLTELQNSVLAAVLLVFIVIIGILGIRSALLVGVSIPGSFLLGILLIGMFGITINMMVLFALIMAVGLLVDGAIGPTPLDEQMLAWLRENEIPHTVVATKMDKVKSSKRKTRRKELAEGCMLETGDIVWVSASKGVNIDQLRGLVTGHLS